ncbi:uncharacterized protein VTP21DRAFT_5291 [Calcarisporiella thermophila]|uniref:uncharacterized protein n=1 Tax=Calcarisporiella thermophila TaxID=911321 RepID=UPI0037429FCE
MSTTSGRRNRSTSHSFVDNAARQQYVSRLSYSAQKRLSNSGNSPPNTTFNGHAPTPYSAGNSDDFLSRNRNKHLSLPLSVPMLQPRLPSYYYEESEMNLAREENMEGYEWNGVRYAEDELLARLQGAVHRKRNSYVDPTASLIESAKKTNDRTTVLDVYDFPSSFKTHHLHDIFRGYENMQGGYRIKWINDTRALIIFEHPTTAKRAYLENVSNTLAKIRPYTGPMDVVNNGGPRRQSLDTK